MGENKNSNVENKMKFDIVIKNGRVIDGAGNPWYKADN